jgi:hypothetical protein
MSGVRLQDLDMSDMLDVIHYIFESDSLSISSSEHADAKDAVRSTIYEDLYNRSYDYGSKKKGSDFSNIDAPLGDFDDDLPVPVDPFERAGNAPPKPFVPATRMDENSLLPFGGVLDAPLR